MLLDALGGFLQALGELLEVFGSSFKRIGGSTTQHRPPKDDSGSICMTDFRILVDDGISAPVEARALILKNERFREVESRWSIQHRPRNEFLGVSWGVFGRSCGFCGRLKKHCRNEGISKNWPT